MSHPVQRLAEVFAVLRPDLSVQPIAVTPTLYADLEARFDAFRGHVLVSEYAFSHDWPTWERHGAGDEIVVLLSGRATFVLRTDAGDETRVLDEAGSYLVVPAGLWHTARVSEPTRMLFITPGEGTEHRANP